MLSSSSLGKQRFWWRFWATLAPSASRARAPASDGRSSGARRAKEQLAFRRPWLFLRLGAGRRPPTLGAMFSKLQGQTSLRLSAHTPTVRWETLSKSWERTRRRPRSLQPPRAWRRASLRQRFGGARPSGGWGSSAAPRLPTAACCDARVVAARGKQPRRKSRRLHLGILLNIRLKFARRLQTDSNSGALFVPNLSRPCRPHLALRLQCYARACRQDLRACWRCSAIKGFHVGLCLYAYCPNQLPTYFEKSLSCSPCMKHGEAPV